MPPPAAVPGRCARPPRGSGSRRGRCRPPRAGRRGKISAASAATSSAVTISSRRTISSTLEERRLGDRRLADAGHPVRGRLEREQEPALQVLLRALELVRPHVAGGDVRELRDRDLQARQAGSPRACRRRAPPARCPSTATRSCRPSTPCRASRGSPGRGGTRRSRRRSRRGSRPRSAARRSGRCPARRGRRGTAPCPSARSAHPGPAGGARPCAAAGCPRSRAPSRRSSSSSSRCSCRTLPAAARTTRSPAYARR